MTPQHLTLPGPAHFEQKLQTFQLFKNDLFCPHPGRKRSRKKGKVYHIYIYDRMEKSMTHE
jgi:hypothetical protein